VNDSFLTVAVAEERFMSPHIIDVTQENAQQVLVEESRERLVVVDFWAEWSEPCKVLSPLLETLVGEYAGAFLLAKLNADALQPIVQQLGVRSIPTVMIMRDGQPVDSFSGALPEAEIRALLEKHLPAPWQALIDQANQLIAEDNTEEALPLLRQAYKASAESAAIGIGLAQVLLQLNHCDDAEAILSTIMMADQDALYEQAMAQLELKREASQSPELKLLESEHEAKPDDMTIAMQLALQYSQSGKNREALELLLSILRRDLGFDEGAAKKLMMDLLASLGKGDSLATEYQRKLFTLLY